MFRCSKCGQLWDQTRARDNELTCTRRCGGALVPVAPRALPHLDGCDLGRLPYPVALTASRLAAALQSSGDVLKTLFLLKDCFEATIKFLGAVLLAEYRGSPARTPERTEVLIRSMIRPTLGAWVSYVVCPLSQWLVGPSAPPGSLAAALFAEPGARPGQNPAESALQQQCKQFVDYRNDAIGHGARRSDAVYESDLAEWLPLIRHLLDGVAGLTPWRLCLAIALDRCQVWQGPAPGAATEPGRFAANEVGHFLLRGPAGQSRDLAPFLCYLPDTAQQNRLHYYDSIYRYKLTKKEATVLEYDNGERHPRPEPIADLEAAFTADLLARAFGWHRGRMEVIEGRVANFGELIEAHAGIVGRRFVIDHVRRFLAEHDRGLLVIEGQPGKGKTALLAHLVEEVFGQHAPRPVHFFYRRTAGITDPDVCVRSLYHSILEAHGITEAEESRAHDSPDEVFTKLTNLLSQEIAPRLLPGRPQLLFIDALDEAAGNAFRRIPENLPAGVFIIASTRPVVSRTTLAGRQQLSWYDLDAPDLLQENLRDGFEYVQRELAGSELPNETLDEIARVGAGNFLVLKLLCQHLRTALTPDQVADFLRRQATDGGQDQLGYIYAQFWERLNERCTRADVNLLCDTAGVLVTAHAPLTADVICGVLGLRAGDWDFALRHLAEYLTAVGNEEEGVCETFYRIYHESFADFLRARVASDRQRYRDRLADFCLGWSRLPEGYGRMYALRFGPQHLVEAGRAAEAAELMLDLFFLEAKAASGMTAELVGDLALAAGALGTEDPRRRQLALLGEAVQRELQFLQAHPSCLFQTLWNLGWWYDSPDAAAHYEPSPEESPAPPRQQPGAKLFPVPERWRAAKEQSAPGFVWVRSLRPPPVPLGSPLRGVLHGHRESVTGLAVLPDGQRLVSAGLDDTLRIWDVRRGRELERFRVRASPDALALSPDGRHVALGCRDHRVHIHDLDASEVVASLDHVGGVDGVAFAPDGRRVAAAALGEVWVWDLAGRRRVLCLRGHKSDVQCVAYSPDGRRIASGDREHSIRVWDAETGKLLRCFPGHTGQVSSLAFSPDGRQLASGSADHTVRVWDAARGRHLARLQGHAGMVTSVAFSPDGQRLVSGEVDSMVRVWDVAGGRELARLAGHQDEVLCLAFFPDGRRIASGSQDHSIRVWDLEVEPSAGRLPAHSWYLHDLAFSPDGRRLASVGIEGTVLVWDTSTGLLLGALQLASMASTFRARFAPDGQRLLTFGNGETTIRVWDARTWEEEASFEDAEVEVEQAAFSPDGQRVAAGSRDGSVRVWDFASRRRLAPLRGHEQAVTSVAFSADGARLYSGCADGSVRGWDAATGASVPVIPGARNAEEAAGLPAAPFHWRIDGMETVIESASGTPLAWLPIPVRHSRGRLGAGGDFGEVYLVALEGLPEAGG